MALRLAKALRYRLPVMPAAMGRIRIAPDHEVADEVPHDYYVVKDYERNPFYSAVHYAQRPGYKKIYDPFKKSAERRETMWWPNYRMQLFDLGLSWTSLFVIIFCPLQMWVTYYWETVRCSQKYRNAKLNPLAACGQRPREY